MFRLLTHLRALLFTLVMATPALAADADEPAVKSYVVCYFIVGLGIALGLVVVCRPAGRRADVKRPD